eukprot:EG_transcript_11814
MAADGRAGAPLRQRLPALLHGRPGVTADPPSPVCIHSSASGLQASGLASGTSPHVFGGGSHLSPSSPGVPALEQNAPKSFFTFTLRSAWVDCSPSVHHTLNTRLPLAPAPWPWRGVGDVDVHHIRCVPRHCCRGRYLRLHASMPQCASCCFVLRCTVLLGPLLRCFAPLRLPDWLQAISVLPDDPFGTFGFFLPMPSHLQSTMHRHLPIPIASIALCPVSTPCVAKRHGFKAGALLEATSTQHPRPGPPAMHRPPTAQRTYPAPPTPSRPQYSAVPYKPSSRWFRRSSQRPRETFCEPSPPSRAG